MPNNMEADQEKKKQSQKSVEIIIDAAFRVIAEQSISGTSMSRIARESGFSKPLLHYHFGNKHALLKSTLKKVLNRFLEIPLENANKNLSPFDEIKAIFKRYKETIITEPELLVVFNDFWVQGVKEVSYREMIAQRFTAYRSYIAQLVSEGVSSGEFSAEKSHMIPPLMLSFLEGASLQLIPDRKAFNYELYQYMALEMIASLAEYKGPEKP